MRFTALILALLGLASPAFAQSLKQAVRVMPIGDSITESSIGLPSYRYWLWHELETRNYKVEFVGSKTGVFNCCPLYPPTATDPWDDDHESYTGARVDQLNNFIGGFVSDARPDVILLHIGTNDLNQVGVVPNQSVASTLTELDSCIRTLQTAAPSALIMVAQIIPAKPAHSFQAAGLQAQYNAGIPGVVAATNRPDAPVVFVDMASGYDAATHNYDAIHPNQWGEQWMARKWREALEPYLTRTTGAWWESTGEPCAGAGAERPYLVSDQGSRPILGTSFTVRVRGIPAGAVGATGYIGFNDTNYAGIPLPWALTNVGLPGCKVYLSPISEVPLTVTGNYAIWTMPLPTNPGLAGLQYHFQAAVRYPAGHPVGIALSNKGTATLAGF